MTNRAAEDGLNAFLETTFETMRREFRVGRALKGTGLSMSGTMIDQLRANADAIDRAIVSPQFRRYRERAATQNKAILEYAASDEPFENYESTILEHDTFLAALEDDSGEHREAVREQILTRARRLGDRLEPLIARPESTFWAATVAALDRTAARTMVEDEFPFTEPLACQPEAFTFEIGVNPTAVFGPMGMGLPKTTIDVSDEVIRAAITAERRVIADILEEVDRQFETAGREDTA